MILAITSPSNRYQAQMNLKIKTSFEPNWIISSLRKKSKIFCLAECNLNDKCLTSVYMESVKSENCFLYRKYFESNETTTANYSNLYKKNSNYFE
jgi:hypothetical protein